MLDLNRAELVERFRRWRAIPVVTLADEEAARPLADALAAGGLPCAEITLRTEVGLRAMRELRRLRPDFIVGAGSVLTGHHARDAVDAGARFLVSPGFGPDVAEVAQNRGVLYIPGALTPTEIMRALAEGLDLIKIFPAAPLGGADYVRALAGPFPLARFIPTGGVSAETLEGYLAVKQVVACGGGWMARPDWIAEGRWDLVEEAARKAATG